MLNDKYILNVFNQELEGIRHYWMDIYWLYYKLNIIKTRYLKRIAKLIKDNEEIKITNLFSASIPNIKIFDIPGIDKYQTLSNYLYYHSTHNDLKKGIFVKCQITVTKSENVIRLNQEYMSLKSPGGMRTLSKLGEYNTTISQDSLKHLIIKCIYFDVIKFTQS